MRIELLQDTVCDGKPVKVGDVVEATFRAGNYLVATKAARLSDASIPDEEDVSPRGSDEEVKISSAAAKYAEENDVDVSLVEGTGKNGNITKGDIQAVIDARAQLELASDDVRDLAIKNDIDLTSIEGTGEDGEVLVEDVEKAMADRDASKSDEGLTTR